MISVSFLSSIHNTKTTIEMIDKENIDYIHVDMMDGKFVENKNYSMEEMTELLNNTKTKLDVHVMIEEPIKYIEAYSKLNTEYYTFHYEAVKDIDTVIEEIKRYGLKPSIAINPDTQVEVLYPYLDKIDMVLIMSVVPGKGGQQFIPSVLDKVKKLKELNKNITISIDGGINNDTSKLAKQAGVDMIVCGSYICKSDNYTDKINSL